MAKNKNIKKIILSVLFAPGLFMKPTFAFAQPVIVDKIAASIEGVGVITSLQLMQYSAISAVMDDGYEKCIGELKDPVYIRSSLNKLIDRMLMLKDAQLLSVKPPAPGIISGMVGQFKAKFKSDKDYDDFMKQYALSADYLSKYMSEELTINQYTYDEIKMLVHVSDKDVASYYKNNKEAYENMDRREAETKIRKLLEQEDYDRELKSWIKTLALHRGIIITY